MAEGPGQHGSSLSCPADLAGGFKYIFFHPLPGMMSGQYFTWLWSIWRFPHFPCHQVLGQIPGQVASACGALRPLPICWASVCPPPSWNWMMVPVGLPHPCGARPCHDSLQLHMAMKILPSCRHFSCSPDAQGVKILMCRVAGDVSKAPRHTRIGAPP